jgi:hypothetical protein
LPLGQQNFQLNGRGCIIFTIEDLRSPDPQIAVAEVAAILRHWSDSLVLRVGKQNHAFNVAAISATYT